MNRNRDGSVQGVGELTRLHGQQTRINLLAKATALWDTGAADVELLGVWSYYQEQELPLSWELIAEDWCTHSGGPGGFRHGALAEVQLGRLLREVAQTVAACVCIAPDHLAPYHEDDEEARLQGVMSWSEPTDDQPYWQLSYEQNCIGEPVFRVRFPEWFAPEVTISAAFPLDDLHYIASLHPLLQAAMPWLGDGKAAVR